jgi:hypothetical protein
MTTNNLQMTEQATITKRFLLTDPCQSSIFIVLDLNVLHTSVYCWRTAYKELVIDKIATLNREFAPLLTQSWPAYPARVIFNPLITPNHNRVEN